MSAAKIITTGMGATEELDGSEAIGPGNVIVQPSCIGECKGPQSCIVFVGPLNLEMKEHGACTGGDGSNSAFDVSVLMMSTNPRE